MPRVPGYLCLPLRLSSLVSRCAGGQVCESLGTLGAPPNPELGLCLHWLAWAGLRNNGPCLPGCRWALLAFTAEVGMTQARSSGSDGAPVLTHHSLASTGCRPTSHWPHPQLRVTAHCCINPLNSSTGSQFSDSLTEELGQLRKAPLPASLCWPLSMLSYSCAPEKQETVSSFSLASASFTQHTCFSSLTPEKETWAAQFWPSPFSLLISTLYMFLQDQQTEEGSLNSPTSYPLPLSEGPGWQEQTGHLPHSCGDSASLLIIQPYLLIFLREDEGNWNMLSQYHIMACKPITVLLNNLILNIKIWVCPCSSLSISVINVPQPSQPL